MGIKKMGLWLKRAAINSGSLFFVGTCFKRIAFTRYTVRCAFGGIILAGVFVVSL